MTTTIDGATGVSRVQDGTVDTPAKLGSQVVTPPKMSGGQSGNAPLFGARAWCLFDGTLTGTNPPLAGGNVASVTRTAAGVYVVNVAQPAPDTNFAVLALAVVNGSGKCVVSETNIARTTASVGLTVSSGGAGTAVVDNALVSVAIFR